MNTSEILALVDDRIALPGQMCPTLDDYSAALAEIHRQEHGAQSYTLTALAAQSEYAQQQAMAANAYSSMAVQREMAMNQNRLRSSAPVSIVPRGRFEVWARVHGSEEAFQIGGPNKTFSTRDTASAYASELMQSQPHLDVVVQEA